MWGCSWYGKNNTVHLYGSLKEFKAAEVNMAPDGAAGEISDAGVIKIPVDADGNFDLVLPLSKPAYFHRTKYLVSDSRRRTKVYLGTSSRKVHSRERHGSQYLSERALFPKAGSFLSAGRNLKPTLKRLKTVDSLAALRMKELEELKNVSKEFKLFEKNGLKLMWRIAICLLPVIRTRCGAIVSRRKNSIGGREILYLYTRDMNPILREIAGSDDYLDVLS